MTMQIWEQILLLLLFKWATMTDGETTHGTGRLAFSVVQLYFHKHKLKQGCLDPPKQT